MTKLIVITGGVYSGLGKGIVWASIWRILTSAHHRVTMIKCDPYLHVDAGTMNPYSHGEVFVCEDGTETDLDLGHYERFVNTDMSSLNSITSGKVYMDILQQERAGVFLWQNVQVIPHITDAIKQKIYDCSQWYDVIIAEIGWTVWDIESPAFYEAVRQLGKDLFANNTLYIHLAPIVYMPHSGEEKTKPLQHSVRDLRQTGIYADLLMCRVQSKLQDSTKIKLSTLCGIPYKHIFESIQADSIYQVPLNLIQQGLHNVIADKLNLDISRLDMQTRSDKVNAITHPDSTITIWLAGKYTQLSDSDLSLMEGLKHAGANHRTRIQIVPIDPQLYESDKRQIWLKDTINEHNIQAIVVPGWFGARGTQGMINIISYARTQKIPFVWICYGMQLAIIEYARNVCGIHQAHSTEIDPQTTQAVIDIMPEQKQISHKGWSMRLGSYQAILKKDSLISRLYGAQSCYERHRHRYEVNPAYHQILQDHGLVICGLSPDGRLAEFIELKEHPEFKSRLEKPSPMFDGLVKCLVSRKQKV